MKRFMFAATLVVMLGSASASFAWGRYYSGGHPYHNGYPFMAPSSAYEAVRVRPPYWRGMPMYYVPQSYLGGSVPGYYPPPTYQYAPASRAGSYYMSAHGAAYSYPW